MGGRRRTKQGPPAPFVEVPQEGDSPQKSGKRRQSFSNARPLKKAKSDDKRSSSGKGGEKKKEKGKGKASSKKKSKDADGWEDVEDDEGLKLQTRCVCSCLK